MHYSKEKHVQGDVMDTHVFLQDQFQTRTSAISLFLKEEFLANFDRKDALQALTHRGFTAR